MKIVQTVLREEDRNRLLTYLPTIFSTTHSYCWNERTERLEIPRKPAVTIQEIVDSAYYNAFYCGHWHSEKQNGKLRILFHDVIML